MAELLLNILKGSNNSFEIYVWEIDENGDRSAMSLSGLTKVHISIKSANNGSDVLADSSSGADITWSGNVITAALGALTIDVGEYVATLKIFDDDHPLGQYLAHPDMKNKLIIRVGE